MSVPVFECDARALRMTLRALVCHAVDVPEHDAMVWGLKFGFFPGHPNRNRLVPCVETVRPDGFRGSHEIARREHRFRFDPAWVNFWPVVEVEETLGTLIETLCDVLIGVEDGERFQIESTDHEFVVIRRVPTPVLAPFDDAA